MKKVVYDLETKETVMEIYGLEFERLERRKKRMKVIENVVKENFNFALEKVSEMEVFGTLKPKTMRSGGVPYPRREVKDIGDGVFLKTTFYGKAKHLSPNEIEQCRRPLKIERPQTFNPEFLEVLSKIYNNEDNIRESIRAEIYNTLLQQMVFLDDYYGKEFVKECCLILEDEFKMLESDSVEIHICKNLSVKLRIEMPFHEKPKWILIKF